VKEGGGVNKGKSDGLQVSAIHSEMACVSYKSALLPRMYQNVPELEPRSIWWSEPTLLVCRCPDTEFVRTLAPAAPVEGPRMWCDCAVAFASESVRVRSSPSHFRCPLRSTATESSLRTGERLASGLGEVKAIRLEQKAIEIGLTVTIVVLFGARFALHFAVERTARIVRYKILHQTTVDGTGAVRCASVAAQNAVDRVSEGFNGEAMSNGVSRTSQDS
jgi:hypothetical protein